MTSLTEKAPICWDLAPKGATHALWSDKTDRWYFWRVVNDSTYYNRYGEWIRHHNQRDSRFRLLDDAIPRECVEPKYSLYETEERSTGMNLRNAALLVRDDINTVSVVFSTGGKPYTYLIHERTQVQPEDYVLVVANGEPKVAQVVEVHEQPQIDPNSGIRYTWVIGNVTHQLANVEQLNKITDLIEEKLKQQQAKSVREQVLAQFGVNSVQDLLGLPEAKSSQ